MRICALGSLFPEDLRLSLDTAIRATDRDLPKLKNCRRTRMHAFGGGEGRVEGGIFQELVSFPGIDGTCVNGCQRRGGCIHGPMH